ncbi:hypothetical protein B10255_16680 [Campylobacter jejuni]|nr:hypothetical protein B10255_16680 [Campylobacter jejuni]HDV6545081.1 hypothetical protein [Campylobacter jejuni]
MLNQNNQELFKPSKEFSRNARIKNLCEYYDLCDEAKEDFIKPLYKSKSFDT